MVIQTQQAYLYVGDDPVNGIDPMGLANCGWNPFCYIGSAYDKANNALNRTLSDVHQGFEGFLSGKSAQDACSNLAVGDQAFCDFGAFFGGVLGFFGDEDGVASEGDESAELGHTYHGAERAADPSRLSTEQEAQVIAHATETFTQADGAKVFVQESEGRFNVVIRNESTGEVITNLKTIDEGALERLAKGYGWIRN